LAHKLLFLPFSLLVASQSGESARAAAYTTMGCRCSTAAAEPREAPTATKGTQLPSATKAPSGEGSDTSTDDASGGSLQMSVESSQDAEKELPKSADQPDQVLSSTPPEAQPESLHGNDIEIEVAARLDGECGGEMTLIKETSSEPDDVAESGKAPKPTLVRSASCMLGTSSGAINTPRDRSRRVSFNEGGPEVVHVESFIEVHNGTLRRANVVSAETIDPAEDPMMEAMLHIHAAEQSPPPWLGGGPDAEAEIRLFDAPQNLQPVPQCVLGRFGFCCITRVDGLPVQGELEYDLAEVVSDAEERQDIAVADGSVFGLPTSAVKQPRPLPCASETATSRIVIDACV